MSYRGRIEAPPITAEHVDRARKILQREPVWATNVQELPRRCGVPKARWWRFIEILNQRGLVEAVSPGVVAVSGRVAGRTFEEFLQGACANPDRFAAWRASADPRQATAEREPGA